MHSYSNADNQQPAAVFQEPFRMPLLLLQCAMDEVQTNIQAPRGLILSTALTAIAIVSQGLIDVRKPNGQVVPTSLMVLTIADSGERKSTVENVFLGPLRDFQRQQGSVYQHELQMWQVRHDIWKARRTALLKDITKKSSVGQPIQDEEQQISSHQVTEPLRPKEFKLLYEDCTSEALFLGLYQNLPTAGLTSSEGGGVLGGRAFNDLSKMNSIWSGDAISVERKTTQSFVLNEARLTVSIMAQVSAVDSYMVRRGEMARGSGLWARFLVCHPQSTQGSRISHSNTQSQEHCGNFTLRLTELLQQNVKLLRQPAFEKEIVEFTLEASERWIKIANQIEMDILPGYQFEGAGDHASKLADNIARVAALFHYFEKLDGGISLETLNAAVEFCASCSTDFLALFMPPTQQSLEADELDSWLNRFRSSGQRSVRKNDIRQRCPAKLRDSGRLDRALDALLAAGKVGVYHENNRVWVDVLPWLPHHQPMPLLTPLHRI
ncbi:YfjI family protein [Pseudomonas siliginis]|uniref:YfjI family protein n=1 Tax=Pseudomonas siliginis TaxID=2842346 RepID=UPI00209216BC|nr:YfjI family protein [Pseudomonas siliginis]USU01362.1 YfjI family protein [Pseudomonas siliginis]